MFGGSVHALRESSFRGNGDLSIPPRGRPRINTGSALQDDRQRHSIPKNRTTKSNLRNSLSTSENIISLASNYCELSLNIRLTGAGTNPGRSKKHYGQLQYFHMTIIQVICLQRKYLMVFNFSRVLHHLTKCPVGMLYYTVLYCKLWTQAVASKSTSKFTQFFYTTNRLPVPL